ncbi:MAG: carboxylesterase/lipase family protein [Nakamurella sp.]
MSSIPHAPDSQPSHPLGPAPLVSTPAGAVRGVMLGPSQAGYLGIPYAEPPLGPLRYALPVKRACWQGIREGSRYGATPLREYMANDTHIPEPSFPGNDTLLVNVFTPRPTDSSAALPVYVWFHGGGFVTGSPSSPWYDGGAFARDGIVVVSVSYRLGLDGFGVIAGAPDNRAVHDWILALEWVHDSIEAFGGDPKRVTIGGQSAGATAVLTLLSMPSVGHLFTDVTAESPCLITADRAEATARAGRLAKLLGIAPTLGAFASLDERAIFGVQAKMGAKEIGLQYVRNVTRGRGSAMGWSPVVDGDLIPYRIEDALSRGVGADKRLLIGATANELDVVSQAIPAGFDRLTPWAALRMAGFGRAAARAYVAVTPGSVRTVLGRMVSDGGFRFNVARMLAARDSAERDAATVVETFAYDFRLPSSETGRAAHCIELPFVWDCLDAPKVVERNTGAHPPQPIADLMHGAWVRFIVSGDPGWPRYQPTTTEGMVVDTAPMVAPVFVRESALTASGKATVG